MWSQMRILAGATSGVALASEKWQVGLEALSYLRRPKPLKTHQNRRSEPRTGIVLGVSASTRDRTIRGKVALRSDWAHVALAVAAQGLA
jgi:hypothetical protein